jgi:hypothetical protein
MKLLHFCFAFILFCGAQKAFAQVNISISDEISIRNLSSYDIIGKVKNRLLLLTQKPNELLVTGFDENMRQSWTKELNLDKRSPEVLVTVGRKDHFDLVYSFKKKGDMYVKLHRYDAGANLIDSVTIHKYDIDFASDDLSMRLSEDKNVILVYKINGNDKIIAFAYRLDTKQMLWKKILTLKEMDFFTELKRIMVTNEGDLYLTFLKNQHKQQQDIAIFRVNAANSQITNFSIAVKYPIYDMTIVYDNKNQRIALGGLYSEKTNARANGYFFMRISPTDISNATMYFEPFDDIFVSTYLGKKEIDKENNGIVDTEVQLLALRQDGGAVILGEHVKRYERASSSASRLGTFGGYGAYGGSRFGSRIMTTDYYNDDIFAISVNPDGKSLWKKILHKRQYSQDDDASFSSYGLMKTPEHIQLLFNDAIKTDATVSEYIVDAEGNADRKSLINTTRQEVRLRLRDAVQTASNEIIVPSEKVNQLKLVKIRF